jgi:hypothetical protein
VIHIFLGILVGVAFLTNVRMDFDQASEAGNVKYCAELHARSCLRFTIRLQEEACIVPARALGWATDPRNSGHPSEGYISFSLDLLAMRTYEETVW